RRIVRFRDGGGGYMPSPILVVGPDHGTLGATIEMLSTAGYRTSGPTPFEDGKRRLDATRPDLVIAGERLGEFNGLHLILHGRAGRPDMAGIVTTPTRVAGLEADAQRLEVDYFVTGDLLQPVSHALDAVAARRRL